VETLIRTADIAGSVSAVRRRIECAAGRTGRDPYAIILIAVTKTIGPDLIRAALASGVSDFGENRVQELAAKVPDLEREAAHRWHLIGHLQRNKVRKAVALCEAIHSVDTVDVARLLSAEAVRQDRRIEVFAQVNISGEDSKSGFSEAALLESAAQLAALPAVTWRGLMTIAPDGAGAHAVRPVFSRLRGLRDRLAGAFDPASWNALSMGMTNDFETAIEEGATHIRVGRAIFGERNAAGTGGSL
jgi:PLP dependent protein